MTSVLKILGVNAFHADAASCVVIDGDVVAAAEEERFTRVKHESGFPSRSIAFCLDSAGISLNDIDYIAINSNPRSGYIHRLLYGLRHRPSLDLIRRKIANRKKRYGLDKHLNGLTGHGQFRGSFSYVDHHLSHLSSAFFCSPFAESAIISVDGFGDFASTAVGLGKDHEIATLKRVFFPHSLGVFYTTMTQYLGFGSYGDEYKVMGLAPYGSPSYVNTLGKLLRFTKDGGFELSLKYFRHPTESLKHKWDSGSPSLDIHFNEHLVDLLGPARSPGTELTERHKDIAASTQYLYEEALFHMLNVLHAKLPSDNLCIAGGCGANSVANGKIAFRTPFKNVYVQAAAGDAGGSIGSALQLYSELTGCRPSTLKSPYIGPSFSNDYIEKLLSSNQLSQSLSKISCKITRLGEMNICDEDAFCLYVAKMLDEGNVVGWFQGKMEWGPRALGNRSILGDPRNPKMQEILNVKIKRRESFRPFAPSILKSKVHEWFEIPDSGDINVPYMMKVYKIREEQRPKIPAVTHVDGTGRLQTVTRELNNRYCHLIESFNKLTGIPILLNTSFNENEPIVCTPEEAISCFLRTNMDMLVLNDFILSRKA